MDKALQYYFDHYFWVFLNMQRVFSYLFIFIFLSSVGFANLQEVVHIQGKNISALEVLDQVKAQTHTEIRCLVEDSLSYRKDYDHRVRVTEVIDAFIEYYQVCNRVYLKTENPSRRLYVLVRDEETSHALAFLKKAPRKKVEGTRFKLSGEKNSNRHTSLQDKSALKVDILEGVSSRTQVASLATRKVAKTGVAKSEALNEGSDTTSRYLAFRRFIKEALGASSRSFWFSDLEGDSLASSKVAQAGAAKQESLHSGWKMAKRRLMLRRTKEKTLEGNETHLRSFSFGGLLSGFLAPPILNSSILKGDEKKISLGIEAMREEGDDPFYGSYKSSLYRMKLGGQFSLQNNWELLIQSEILVHTGDFAVAGLGSADLDLSLGESVLGLDYLFERGLPLPGRSKLGLRLKLPTGSAKNLSGTESIDFGAYVAQHISLDTFNCFVQLGATRYGDYEGLVGRGVHHSLSVSTGLEFPIQQNLLFNGAASFSKSPFKKMSGPDFLEDDVILLQAGLRLLKEEKTIGLDLSAGVSESAPEFALSLSFERIFK